jgi:CheY-like chemotaxis protein
MGVSEHCLSLAADVMLVDNDIDGSEALADLLQYRGYSVARTSNGSEALNYLKRFSRPRVIILDLLMPVMDGPEFLEHQSSDPALLDIPVVILTGTPPLRPLPAKAILLKPVHPKELFEIIERFLPAEP